MQKSRRPVCNTLYYKQSVAEHGGGQRWHRGTGVGGVNVDTSINETRMAAAEGTE